jgi:prepilin-type N-terminal cleavage/methylation domain-containing protein
MKRLTRQAGFTLIELLTAVSLFLVVMTISMGAIIGIFDANEKVGSLKTVMDNLNFAMETMSREIRFGENYHCGTTGTLTSPQNCLSGASFISFLSNDGVQTVYRLNGTSLEKSINGGSTYTTITAVEINIQSLSFFVTGATADSLQPRVLINIKGQAGTKSNTTSGFVVQTVVSQRLLDNTL